MRNANNRSDAGRSHRRRRRVSRGRFTPCTRPGSLLEAVTEAAKRVSVRGAVLFSPACSSFDQFRNAQQRGLGFCDVMKSISGGVGTADPHMDGKMPAVPMRQTYGISTFARGFFEGKPAGKNPTQLIPQMKGRNLRHDK